MKVVKKGENNQVTCPCCGSVLEFEPHDISRKSVGRDADDGDEIFSYSIQCSVCKHSVSVGNITGTMRSRVDEIHEIQKNRDLSDYDV